MEGGAGKNRAQLVHRWKPELHPYKTSAGQAKGGVFFWRLCEAIKLSFPGRQE